MHDFGTLLFRRTCTLVSLECRIGMTFPSGELMSDLIDFPIETPEGTATLGRWLDLEHDA
jgi:hypothetical protein